MTDDIGEQIRLHLAGDDAGTEAVARASLTLALRTAAAVLGDRDAALDVAQEVAVEVVVGVKRLRDPAAFDAWVHRITVRRTMRVLRARQQQRRREEPLDGQEFADWAAASGGDTGPLVAALADLPHRQRVALALRYVHDLSDQEIASALGCRTGTVASLLSRGREALRRHPSLEPFSPGRAEGVQP
jgi:RNA polymerase sigma-70 factor (ECF subfamily)